MISTHALREEGDMVRCTLRETVFNFYPRPPRGGRLQRCSVAADVILFLPTPSARRATSAGLWKDSPHKVISTHALREEGDIDFLEDAIKEDLISTHALREEGDGCRYIKVLYCHTISTHALREEGDSLHPIFLQSSSNFYPRPPRGGRQPILCYSFAECQFLPTPSARRATGVTVVDYRGAVKFLPTPSARRATFLYRLSQRDLRISTHALREEGDLCQWGVRGSVHHFYPRPPRGGRRTSPNASKMGDYFYPRPPRGGRLGCNGSPGA